MQVPNPAPKGFQSLLLSTLENLGFTNKLRLEDPERHEAQSAARDEDRASCASFPQIHKSPTGPD